MGATFSMVKSQSTGGTILAADWNAEFLNILNNLTPTGMDDASTNATAMQTTADPYPGGAESLATSLSGELQRIRYVLSQISGMTYWYQDPVETIWIPAGSMIPTTTNGAAPATEEYSTNDIMFDYLAFDGATEEFASLNIVMPEKWDLGTVKAKFYWRNQAGAGVGDTVEWEMAAIARGNTDEIDTAPGTGQVISDTVLSGTSPMHISGATPAITIGGTPALGDVVHFKVSRNVGGTDDMTEDAYLFGVLIQYKTATNATAW